jgi:hypothetical protein
MCHALIIVAPIENVNDILRLFLNCWHKILKMVVVVAEILAGSRSIGGEGWALVEEEGEKGDHREVLHDKNMIFVRRYISAKAYNKN